MSAEIDDHQEKKQELLLFLLLTVVLAPVLAVATIGIYGFAIWFSQILTGPPTH